ncbi:FAD-dependent oxidoreductase [Clostridium sp. Marseille-P2415]|uniref:FAD-dependent oxidoreductase n=1 Tax=Clostridium sp. Marseille-P2415 TaxID=1805471 RepID=UPI0009883020|nr:FAD-binding protein [Clostridium sp. Marseille-P2415]
MKTQFKMYTFHTIIIGSGAAAYNAADSLYDLGQKDIAIITEGKYMGTSRNTGSDKQTYYKLSMAGKQQDSVYSLAETLFRGGSMHGDTALVEAALSPRCFFKLVQLGVPFPSDNYGQYAGYKTDHDPMLRATSCGPLTSKLMTECLEASVNKKQIPVFDGYRAVHLFTEEVNGEKKAKGILTVYTEPGKELLQFVCFHCRNVIYATGGPAGIYGSSVYPESQTGAHGVAFLAGAVGNNVTEWQYGIASVDFRWNLSGSYQQVIPRYISVNQDMGDGKEFLEEYFTTPEQALSAIFLKGYQWPFDPRKTGDGGSSLVDLAVYHEIKIKGRRVFLDYTRNPGSAIRNGEFDFSILSQEAYTYLNNCGILFGTPIERLKKMNRKAYQLYLDHGIDLEKDLLEIDVCAQHNNGGLKVDLWWQSNIRNLFPVGEAAGTFGVYRPGGTALNSTQVGSLRAAQCIAKQCSEKPEEHDIFQKQCEEVIDDYIRLCRELRESREAKKEPMALRHMYQQEMDVCGGFVRKLPAIEKQIHKVTGYLRNFSRDTYAKNVHEVLDALVNRDILITQLVYLNGMKDYIDKGGNSRGSYLIQDTKGEPIQGSDLFEGMVQEIELLSELRTSVHYQTVRPLPDPEVWFEDIYNA